MCGLFAFWSSGVTLEAEARSVAIESLTRLRHRGPDHSDFICGEDWFIGHNRLSVIDLSEKSNQPMTDPTSRYSLAYNGELYNLAELRLELRTRGVNLRSESDTEVLLHLLILDGLDSTLSKISGMFSFILYDALRRTLVCARDHLGQKPLYFSYRAGRFIAASEVTPLIKFQSPLEPDLVACRTYLCTGGIIAPDRTFFKDIHCLPAGHTVTVTSKDISVREFFHITNLFDSERLSQQKAASEDDAVDQLGSLIGSSVKNHLIGDVPIGILLSGGIDSSLLLSYASQLDSQLISYTKVSPKIEVIPSTIVPKLTRLYGSTNRSIKQDPTNYLQGLIRFVEHTSTPSRWGGGPPMASVCNAARIDGVKVLLGGDGVDESALGYNSHLKMLRKFEGNLHSIHQPLALDDKSGFYDAVDLTEYLDLRQNERTRALRTLSDIDSDIERFAKAIVLHDCGSFLQSCTLPHSDAYSMMESIELRNPFLDLELLKFVINLPLDKLCDLKAEENGNKLLFRQLAKKRIGNFLNMPKEGTRNYSMWISEPSYWDFASFKINEFCKIPDRLDKKQIFRVLNLEIFWRHYFSSTQTGQSIMSAITPTGVAQMGLMDKGLGKYG